MKNLSLKRLIPLPVSVIMILSCTGQAENHESETASKSGGLTLPNGFRAIVVASSLGRGRHIAVNNNGDIYLSLEQKNNDGGIVALRDTNSDAIADIVSFFGQFTGTGIKIHDGYLYFGADTAVVRYKLIEGELVPDKDYELIAYGFGKEGQHAAKPFTFDDNNNIYVNVGAPSNACQEPDRTPGTPGLDPCPILNYAGGIWRFKADEINQNQRTEGYRYATGLRNCVAISWNHSDNHLYVVQQGRDQLAQFFPDLYTQEQGANLPAEAFYKLNDGDNCGWPYCYYDNFKNKLVLAPEYGGNGDITGRCADKTDPIMAFPAHTSPDDLLFYTGNMFPEKYKNGAFIAFHGSWNRSPEEQEGYYVAFVPFENNKPVGNWEIFANGFAGKEPVMSPADAEYRPCGLAQGPDGSLYIADSEKGRIWRIFYNK